MVVVNCYKASISKTEEGVRIYLYASYEQGGDTEIVIKGGDMEARQEEFTVKKGLPITSGWKTLDIAINRRS